MTEQNIRDDWLACMYGRATIEFGNYIKKMLPTIRTKRLFAYNCACSPNLPDIIKTRSFIKLVESYGNHINKIEFGVSEYRQHAEELNDNLQINIAYSLCNTFSQTRDTKYTYSLTFLVVFCQRAVAYLDPHEINNDRKKEVEYQAEILIKLLRPDWTFNPNWITEVTKSLAIRINDEKRNDLTPILADALEDNGCDNQNLLNYLRTANNLIKGDWIIDHLTNKR